MPGPHMPHALVLRSPLRFAENDAGKGGGGLAFFPLFGLIFYKIKEKGGR